MTTLQMETQGAILDHLKDVFLEMEQNLNGTAGNPMHTFHRQSFETLQEVNFPDRKHEDWKYTSVQRLLSPKYKLATGATRIDMLNIPGLKSYVIPVINGKVMLEAIDPALTQQGVSVIPLIEAFELPGWKNAFHRIISDSHPHSGRAFEFLNFSFHTRGFYLEIPPHLILDHPVEIRIVHDDPEISFSHPLYFVHAGAGSQCTLFERFEKNTTTPESGVEALINALAFIYTDRNAHVSHVRWQNLSATQNLVYTLLTLQQRDSRFETFGFDMGGALVRNTIEAELDESNTFTSLLGGYLAKGRQSMDHQTRINHKVPHCESHELYKGIVDAYAAGAFNGKVYVHQDAQKTNAFQQNDTLVLSPHALMNSKPQLEIYADDVKCSHGATIGQLDDRALFYLRSRGLDAETSKHMLKSAFLATVVDQIPNPFIQEYIRSGMSLDL